MGAGFLTVIVDKFFYVTHDLKISPLSNCGHVFCGSALRFEDCRRLRVQHEGHCKKAFDPFYLQIVSF
jgi:hypothetical protein